MSVFSSGLVVFLTLITAGACHTLLGVCPPNWLVWNDSCYVLLAEKMNWWEASKVCDRPGSSLVVPDSQEEHEFIWREMEMWMGEFGASPAEMQLWIGCKDMDNSGRVICSGEEGEHAFEHWSDGEPNSDNQCVRMAEKFDGKWGDVGCESEKYVACEMSASSSPRTYCLQADAAKRNDPQCLLNHDIQNLTTTGVLGCGQACWAEPRCHSFNLWQQDDKGKICQLNRLNRLEADVTDFKHVQNCHFFEL